MTPAILYRSTDRATAQPARFPTRRYPLPESSLIRYDAYAFDVDYQCQLTSFPPAPQNTPSDDPALQLGDEYAILTSLTQPQFVPGGSGKFTAAFARVPGTWDDFKTTSYTFPGWIGVNSSATTREITPKKVNMRLRYDYFVLDPTGILNGGSPVTSPTNGTVFDSAGNPVQLVGSKGHIPQISKNQFFNTVGGAPAFNSPVNSLVAAAGFSGGYVKTFPTTEDYQAWLVLVAAAIAAGTQWQTDVWNGTNLSQTNVGQLVADDSWIEDYAGQIVARVTPHVLIN